MLCSVSRTVFLPEFFIGMRLAADLEYRYTYKFSIYRYWLAEGANYGLNLSISYVFPDTTGTRLWHMPINLGTIRTSRYAPLYYTK